MKRLFFAALVAALVAALTAPDAEACLAGRARARQTTRTRTVQTVRQAPPVRETIRAGVRVIVDVPLTAAARLRAALPCPGCK